MAMKAFLRTARAIQGEQRAGANLSPDEIRARIDAAKAERSTLGKVGREIDPTRKGSLGSKLAPIAVGLVPGVGPLGAAAIGGGLGLASGGGAEGALRGAATYGAADYALGKAGDMLRGGGAPQGTPQPGGEFDLPPLPGRINPMGGGVGGVLGRVGRFALDNPELVAGGIGVLQAANQQGNADRRRSAALGALDDFGGGDVAMPDFTDYGNPYSRGRTGRSRVSALNSLTRGY